jgi:hypothetical protein
LALLILGTGSRRRFSPSPTRRSFARCRIRMPTDSSSWPKGRAGVAWPNFRELASVRRRSTARRFARRCRDHDEW